MQTGVLIQRAGGFQVKQALFHGFAPQHVRTHAAAIVCDNNFDMVAALPRGQAHDALRGLACGLAFVGSLNAVVNGITHKMHQRIGEVVDHAAVDLGFLAGNDQFNILAEAARQIACETRVFLEQATHRLHACFHHRVLQVGYQQVQLIDGAIERR